MMDAKQINICKRCVSILVIFGLFIGGLANAVHAAPGDTQRVSIDSGGGQGNGYSKSPAISADGRFVAFRSSASNLVSGDTNATEDVFVHDRQSGTTTRVSVDSSGIEANGYSGAPAISDDGRFVAFSSSASNLVSGDTNGRIDIFVHDRQSGTTSRVSIATSGDEANGDSSEFFLDISADGQSVTFPSEANNLVENDTNGMVDIFVHDRQTSQTTRVSVDSSGTEANQYSNNPSLSSDGRYVTFSSNATNLVSGDTNAKGDIFLHDRQTGVTSRVSVSSSGEQADKSCTEPAISGDGRYVTFSSEAQNLVPGAEFWASIYIHDLQTGQTKRASVLPDGSTMVGTSSDPVLSSSGQYVAFVFDDRGDSEGLTEIFIHNQLTGEIVQATFGGSSSADSSYWPSISADGSILAFESPSASLVSGDTNGVSDIFVHEVSFVPDQAPYVDSIIQDCPRGCTSAADPIVDFTVTFSESVSGVTTDDFYLTEVGDLSGTSIAEIIGTGDEYTVAVNTGTGTGTLRLDLIDNDSIQDGSGNPLGGVGEGNGTYTIGPEYAVDRSTPVVTNVLRLDPDPTTADNVGFNVNFSEEVVGVDISDFNLATTGSLSGLTIANISGSGISYSVNVNTGSGDGTLRLYIIDNDSITDPLGNPLGGQGTDNGNFNTGEVYTIDNTAPSMVGSLRADPNPTTADRAAFIVAFSEAVSGVDSSDFQLTVTGNVTDAAIIEVSGSGNTYTVVIETGTGDGTIRLDLADNDSIIDALGNPLGGAGVGTGNYTSGEVYSISKKPLPTTIETFRSNGKNDGWVLEANANSGTGGYMDNRSATFVVGDDSRNAQFRSILHFPTHYLPNNAVITRVLLMIKKETLVGSDPFETHQNILVDIRSGAFGYLGPFPFRGLQISDFESPSSQDSVGIIENNPYDGWYWSYLNSTAFAHINLYGITQIRLRFQIPNDGDNSNDYLRFFSGDYKKIRERPRLLVEYYIKR